MIQKSMLAVMVLFTCTRLVYAQQADSAFASVRYKLTHIDDTTQPERPSVSNWVLFIGRQGSNYTNYDRLQRSNNLQVGTISAVTVTGGGGLAASSAPQPVRISVAPAAMSSIGNYYKNMEQDMLSLISFAGGKLFSVEDKIPVIQWAISQDTKEIGGLTCQKATGRFKGRDYEAWFCSQLPYNNGPWKLGGLPGLIVEAYDTKKEVVFNFVEMDGSLAKPVPVSIPKDALHTSLKEFEQYQEALKRDRDATKGETGGVMAVRGVLSGGTFTGLDGKPVKPKQMNNPIEKAAN